MEPADELLTEESIYSGKTCKHDGQVFAKKGECYALYLPTAKQTGVLDLKGAEGEFTKRWYNPRTGKFEGVPENITGGNKLKMGLAPGTPNEDWVVFVMKSEK